mmetsp:Transcript_14988/g.18281  ORF Transcript_14988/g.18281 Transcript_14988/m.18281 type:complete len:739 (+) Transcript_14988:189-2405(+)
MDRKSTNSTDSTSSDPPKRAQRQRNPVILLQNDYFTMYDDKNNRKGRAKTPNTTAPSNSPTNPSDANGGKKRKSPGKSSTSHEKKRSKTSQTYMSKSIYRWIGPPISKPSVQGKSEPISQEQSGRKYYQKLEIRVGDHPALLSQGDFVLISSCDYKEEQLFDRQRTPVNMNSRSKVMHGMTEKNDDEIMNSTLRSDEMTEVAMNKLDPYVGRVEEMWEDPLGDEEEGDDDPHLRMNFRVRWFFKKSDVVKLSGQFIGVSRQQLLSSLTARDLLLGEQSDVNNVTTILGKCKVLRCKPVDIDDSSSAISSSSSSRGAFHSRYDITIQPPKKSSGKGKIIITPYEGPDEEDDQSSFTAKRVRAESSISQSSGIDALAAEESLNSNGVSDVDSLAATESIDQLSKAAAEGGNDDDSSVGTADKRQQEKQPPITEGSANVKIKVGPGHQALIPTQVNKRRYSTQRESPPLLVWKAKEVTDTKLELYVKEATDILKEYMKEQGIQNSRNLPHNAPKDICSDNGRKASLCAYREINIDDLLLLLHDHNYNTKSALRGLKKFPQDYLFVWTKEDKELYNAGFQRHSNNLHCISKSIGENKNHKDVVDYHYRFSIPTQFKRFQDKKREDARRMFECGERFRLEEYLSEGGQVNNGTNGSKKSQLWSKTGGEIGEVEARRLGCKGFLVEVRDTVGLEKYLVLVKLLQGLNSRVITIPQLKEGFASILHQHPKLSQRFESYLPEKFRA